MKTDSDTPPQSVLLKCRLVAAQSIPERGIKSAAKSAWQSDKEVY